MAKRKNPVDIRLPLPIDFSLSPSAPVMDQRLQKDMLRTAIKASYEITDFEAESNNVFNKPTQMIADDKINMVTSLMQSLQPLNAVEAALATQFTATYVQGIKLLQQGNMRQAMPLLAFSQTTLDSLNRFRNKGSQQINVQYNVNQGQVVNIKTEKMESRQDQ